MALGAGFEFSFWDMLNFERAHTLFPFPPYSIFDFLTQFSAQHEGFHKRHGIRFRGVAKEPASLLLEGLHGGSRALSSCIDRHPSGRVIEASLSGLRFITYRNCCHLPKFVTETWRIGYQQAPPVHPAPRLPTAVEQRAPWGWGTCTRANPPLSCRGILIRPTYTGKAWLAFIL